MVIGICNTSVETLSTQGPRRLVGYASTCIIACMGVLRCFTALHMHIVLAYCIHFRQWVHGHIVGIFHIRPMRVFALVHVFGSCRCIFAWALIVCCALVFNILHHCLLQPGTQQIELGPAAVAVERKAIGSLQCNICQQKRH